MFGELVLTGEQLSEIVEVDAGRSVVFQVANYRPATRQPLEDVRDQVADQLRLQEVDAVFVMYHDQGLPVLKHHGFGEAVNVTLGLPFVRTSVDHGTALDLAAVAGPDRCRVDTGSLRAALRLAEELVG